MAFIPSRPFLTGDDVPAILSENAGDVAAMLLPYLGIAVPVSATTTSSASEHIAWLLADTNSAHTFTITLTARNTTSTKALHIIRAVSLIVNGSGTRELHAHDLFAQRVGTGWTMMPDVDGNDAHLVVAAALDGVEVTVVGLDVETILWTVRIDAV